MSYVSSTLFPAKVDVPLFFVGSRKCLHEVVFVSVNFVFVNFVFVNFVFVILYLLILYLYSVRKKVVEKQAGG